ncbi:titin-like isoform X2 [Anthonomus grandis grandis]|uniref:titin-like isoform X2 n=1 Tax=Anthonomus grandis grandis TaxID=2921223 RepID=UPI00216535C3|nr:titin-like isoform X2 [Anthonomus grandis grandis]
MANKDDYLTTYREFFEYFEKTINPNDQLPVKLGSYKLLNVEVVGGIIDWTTQYLSQKQCPPHLLSTLIKIIIEEIRKGCKKQPLSYGFVLGDNAYEPLKLMQAVMAKTNQVCLRYKDNSMLCSLPPPSNTYFVTSIYAARNRRRKMEDRHVAIHDLNTMFSLQEASPSSYYAIFDGHAGHDAAAYSAAHLHQFLAENKYFASNPVQALLDAFCKTDALFLEKCKVENLSGGSTAVVALLRPKEKTLYIAWVGDSQALLVNQGKVLQCVNPHKPSREDERQRIEKAGGCVMLWGTWRVNGQLAVSRAIGDADYKPHVIAIPDVREITLDGGEDFLILACDGLWDFLSEDAAANEVYYMISDNPDDTERIGKQLVQLARYQGSSDNISVIVVFLRDPHQIASEAHRWAPKTTTTTTTTMEAGLDNANNPFTNSNGTLKNLEVETDNINLQKSAEGLLLNLTDNFKSNGTDHTPELFEKSNGTKKSTSELTLDDDFGPETDVDAVDDAFSPIETDKAFTDKDHKEDSIRKSFSEEVKAFADGLANNNPFEDPFNPLMDQNKELHAEEPKEVDFGETFKSEEREDTPSPAADNVNDAVGLDTNAAESDSEEEDEWNYIKGDQTKVEGTTSSQPETVEEASEQDDGMSNLNPNAAEFVPVSPTRSIPSPACRTLINEEVISQSPKRPAKFDINLPGETEFESEFKSRPSDFDYENGHNESDHDEQDRSVNSDKIENILNGKSLDEIPEFHPGSTPSKVPPQGEEFHFGPNAAPFTPRVLDQSEALSTKANFGDDTEQTLNASFNDSDLIAPSKEQSDPMSMSFYAEQGEANPFEAKESTSEEDLNKVHDIPDNLDDFLQETAEADKENNRLCDTISDLPEHFPLDKISQDDEKELASPLEEDLLVPSNDDVLKQPEVSLFEDFSQCNEKEIAEDLNIPELEPIVKEEEEKIEFQQPDLISPMIKEDEFSCTQEEEVVKLLDQQVSSPLPPQEQGLEGDLSEASHIEERPDSQTSDDFCKSPVSEAKEPEQLEKAFELNFEKEVDEYQFNPPKSDEIHSQDVCQFSPNREVEEESHSQADVDECKFIPRSAAEELHSQIDAEECQFNPKSALEDRQLSSEDLHLQNDVEEFNPISEAETLDLEPKEATPIASPACEYSAEESCKLERPDSSSIPETHSPIDLLQEHKQEEVTSSVKDDASSIEPLSPAKSPESFGEEQIKPEDDQREAETKQEEEIHQVEVHHYENKVHEEEGVAESHNEQICIKTDTIAPEFAESAVITPSEEGKAIDEPLVPLAVEPEIEKEQLLVNKEEATPEVVHQAEEVPKVEEVSSLVEEVAKPVEEIPKSVQEVVPKEEEVKLVEAPKEEQPQAPTSLPIVPASPLEVKTDSKKSTTPVSSKKPTEKPEARKSVGVIRSKPTTVSSPRTSTAPRVPSKTGPAKSPALATKTTTSTTSASKPLPKPKTTPITSKATEKKPLANGDAKPKTTLAKKPATEAVATKTTAARPATAPRPAPAKPAPTSRPITAAPRTTLSKTVTDKPKTATTTLPAPPKPRVNLTSKTSTTAAAKSSSVTLKSSTRTTTATTTSSTAAGKPATAPAKPRTVSSAPPKPRVPLTKTVTKSADLEKEKKESANKLTASQTSTVAKSSSVTHTSRTTTSTVRKTETKVMSDRTLASRTSTSRTTTGAKKPGETAKTATSQNSKVKTTKVEKPKQNGIAPAAVTEEIKETEITIVNNVTSNATPPESETLLKDNSPIDNKLIEISNTLID